MKSKAKAKTQCQKRHTPVLDGSNLSGSNTHTGSPHGQNEDEETIPLSPAVTEEYLDKQIRNCDKKILQCDEELKDIEKKGNEAIAKMAIDLKQVISNMNSSSTLRADDKAEFANSLNMGKLAKEEVKKCATALRSTKKEMEIVEALKKICDMVNEAPLVPSCPENRLSDTSQSVYSESELRGYSLNSIINRMKKMTELLEHWANVLETIPDLQSVLPTLADEVKVYCSRDRDLIEEWFKNRVLAGAVSLSKDFWVSLYVYTEIFEAVIIFLRDHLKQQLKSLSFEGMNFDQDCETLTTVISSMKQHFELCPKGGGDLCWHVVSKTVLQKIENIFDSDTKNSVVPWFAQIEKWAKDDLKIHNLFVMDLYFRRQGLKAHKEKRNQCINEARLKLLEKRQKPSDFSVFEIFRQVYELVISSMDENVLDDSFENIVYMFILTLSANPKVLSNGRICVSLFCEANWLCDNLAKVAMLTTSKTSESDDTETEMQVENSGVFADGVKPVTEATATKRSGPLSSPILLARIRETLLRLCVCLRETADNRFRALLSGYCEREFGKRLDESIKNAQSVNEVSTAVAEILTAAKEFLSDMDSVRGDFFRASELFSSQNASLMCRVEEKSSVEKGKESDPKEPDGNEESFFSLDDVKVYLCARFVKIFGSHFQTFTTDSLDQLMVQTLMFLESFGIPQTHLMFFRDSLDEDYRKTR